MSRDAANKDEIVRLNQLIDEGHDDAERHGAIGAEDLDRMLDHAKNIRLAARTAYPDRSGHSFDMRHSSPEVHTPSSRTRRGAP